MDAQHLPIDVHERMAAAVPENERSAFEMALAVRRGQIAVDAPVEYQRLADVAVATLRLDRNETDG